MQEIQTPKISFLPFFYSFLTKKKERKKIWWGRQSGQPIRPAQPPTTPPGQGQARVPSLPPPYTVSTSEGKGEQSTTAPPPFPPAPHLPPLQGSIPLHRTLDPNHSIFPLSLLRRRAFLFPLPPLYSFLPGNSLNFFSEPAKPLHGRKFEVMARSPCSSLGRGLGGNGTRRVPPPLLTKEPRPEAGCSDHAGDVLLPASGRQQQARQPLSFRRATPSSTPLSVSTGLDPPSSSLPLP